MSKRARELVAVAILVVLVIASLFGLAFYIYAGHSWNFAATNIDDSLGNMNGYTVVAYRGTQASDDEDSSSAGATESSASSGASDEADAQDVDVDEEAVASAVQKYQAKGAVTVNINLDDLGRYREPVVVVKNQDRIGILYVDDSTSTIQADKYLRELEERKADYIIVVSGASMRKTAQPQSSEAESGESSSKASDSNESSATTAAASTSESSASSAAASSQSSASSDEEKNEDAGSSASSSASSKSSADPAAIETYLQQRGGVDIIINTVENGYSTLGANKHGVFMVSTPAMGNVGALLVSPSHVVSAKVLSIDED